MSTMEQPTTEVLRLQHGIAPETELKVIEARSRLGYAIDHHQEYFISNDGTCALTNQPQIIAEEGRAKVDAAHGLKNYIGLNRSFCFFKPRSDPNAWSGMDATERAIAYMIVAAQAEAHANCAAEIGSVEQLIRYGSMLTFGWVGGRAINNGQLIKDIATKDKGLPFGAKNDLDGTIETALERVAMVEEVRDGEGAPAILVYRGGSNAKTPKSSKDMCKRVIYKTEGRVIIDTAHGVEMAHDPSGKFGKSMVGQILATEMLLELGQEGYLALGKMSEASAQKSPMDPHMPLAVALDGSKNLYDMKSSGLLVPVRHTREVSYTS